MSEKKAKEQRKMEKQLKQAIESEVSIAGCPGCGGGAWYIVLDAAPPLMQEITQFVCVACRAGIPVNIDLKEMRGLEPIEDTECDCDPSCIDCHERRRDEREDDGV